jgi:hypothetical protein
MKKIISILTLLIIYSTVNFNNVYAQENSNNELKTKVEKIFSTFVQSSEKKQSKSVVYKKVIALESKISSVIFTKKLSKTNYIIYNTLLESTREYISDYQYYQQEIKKNILL